MNINTASIRFRLLASFAAMGIITIFLVGITLVGVGYLANSTREVFIHKQPSQTWVMGLSAAIQKTNVTVQNYLLFEEVGYKAKWEKNWDTNVKEALDSLTIHVEKWNDPESQVIYARILNRLQTLKEAQKSLFESQGDQASYSDDDFDLMALMGDENEDVGSESSNKEIFRTKVYPISEELDQLSRSLYESIYASTRKSSADVNFYLIRFRIIEALMIVAALVAAWFLYYLLSRKIQSAIKDIKGQINILSQGNIPAAIHVSNDELKIVHEEIEVLATNLNNVRSFATEVGEGKFDNDITVFNNSGEIGTSLAGMRDSLKKVAEEDTIRNWTNKGVAEFGDILRKYSDNLDELSDKLLTGLVKYLKANQGSLFVLNNDEDGDNFLELKACYAFDRKKYLEKRVEFGQGLVGQCYLEKQTIHLRQVPDEYISITSGLGLANPKFLLIVPLRFNESVYGIVEIASFQDFKHFEIDFVEKLGESVASSLSSVKTNQNTRRLLQESQMMTEQMRAQEEEMRQNMEELQATQEEMQRNTREQDEQQDELKENYEKLRASREESGYLAQQMQHQFQNLDSAIIRVNFSQQATILDANVGFTEVLGKSLAHLEDRPLANYLEIYPEEAWSRAMKGEKVKVQMLLKFEGQLLSGFFVKQSEEAASAIMFIGHLMEKVEAKEVTNVPKDDSYLKERLQENADLLKKLKEE